MANIEMRIVDNCEAEPFGDPHIDKLRSKNYRDCCERVLLEKHSMYHWTGCRCRKQNHGGYACNDWGEHRFQSVRMGIYVWSLRSFYRYMHSDQVLITSSDDFFEAP